MIEEICGWIANAFFLYGVYALSEKDVKGFYFNTLGNILYVVQSIIMNNSALLWLSIGLIILNIRGIKNWKKI